MTPLEQPEYVCIKLSDIHEEITKEYNLQEKASADRSVYIEITKGIHELPQDGFLANKFHEKCFNPHGYQQSKIVSGIWKHDWQSVQLALVLDNFGVKYVGKDHVINFAQAIGKHYKYTTD